MMSISIRRNRNVWGQLKDQIAIPYAVWELDAQKLDGLLDTYSREKIQDFLLKSTKTHNHLNNNSGDIFSLIASKIHSCDVDSIFLWLLNVKSSNNIDGFCYPFLDERIASYIGPMTLDFMVKAASFLKQAKSADVAEVEMNNLLKTYWVKIRRVEPFLSNLQILMEAKNRGIPTMGHSNLPSYQLGYGAHKRIVKAGFTDGTSRLAASLATHKFLAQNLLHESGCPVPKNFLVKSFDDAQKASNQLGLPVVVKPESMDKGVGVTVGVDGDDELRSAWQVASQYGGVLIEEMIQGFDHRLHVVNGKCIYVTKRVPPYVVGDGTHKLKDLVEFYTAKRSSDPEYKSFPSAKLSDPAVIQHLNKNGFNENSILSNGQIVYLRSNANVSTGGFAEEVTQECHPDNKLLAERAARIVGLDNAGVDLITTNINLPWAESNAKICEINPTPAFGKRVAYDAILDYLFPNSSVGRIPIVLFVGEIGEVTNYINVAIKKQNQYSSSYGYILDGKLYIKSSNGLFASQKLGVKNLLKGLLSDVLVESALIHINYKEFKDSLSIDYFSLVVAIGDQFETFQSSDFDCPSRCSSNAVLINPDIIKFQDAIDSLLQI